MFNRLSCQSYYVSGITVFGLKIRIFTFLNFLESFQLRSILTASLKNFQGCIVVYLSKNFASFFQRQLCYNIIAVLLCQQLF